MKGAVLRMSATTYWTTWNYNSENCGLHFTHTEKLNSHVGIWDFRWAWRLQFCAVSSHVVSNCETAWNDIPEHHGLQTVTFYFFDTLKTSHVHFGAKWTQLISIWHGSLEYMSFTSISTIQLDIMAFIQQFYVWLLHISTLTLRNQIYILKVFCHVPTCTLSSYCHSFYLVPAHHQHSCTHNALSFSCC